MIDKVFLPTGFDVVIDSYAALIPDALRRADIELGVSGNRYTNAILTKGESIANGTHDLDGAGTSLQLAYQSGVQG